MKACGTFCIQQCAPLPKQTSVPQFSRSYPPRTCIINVNAPHSLFYLSVSPSESLQLKKKLPCSKTPGKFSITVLFLYAQEQAFISKRHDCFHVKHQTSTLPALKAPLRHSLTTSFPQLPNLRASPETIPAEGLNTLYCPLGDTTIRSLSY